MDLNKYQDKVYQLTGGTDDFDAQEALAEILINVTRLADYFDIDLNTLARESLKHE